MDILGTGPKLGECYESALAPIRALLTIHRRVLLFPSGNNVDFASLYLEQGYEEGDQKPPEGWYACAQFTLVIWNKRDPSIHAFHSERYNITSIHIP